MFLQRDVLYFGVLMCFRVRGDKCNRLVLMSCRKKSRDYK